MTEDIGLAFAHPEARAMATTPEPRDRISVRDYTVEVEIGAFQAERDTTQRVRFNVVVEVQPIEAPVEDDVDRILSYDAVTEAISGELSAERLNLLETLAERIAERILREPQAVRVFVRVEKLDRVPGALGVEIVRQRDPAPIERQAGETPHPRLLCLGNGVIGSPALGAWIDRFTADGAPVVICVGLPETAAPQSARPAAQHRIDLLAIDQNAWVLAGTDSRCVVVGTRTELDWGMKNGQISVWAPSKIVLDAVDGFAGTPRDSAALAAWFAELMQAREVVVLGTEAPASDVRPVRVIDPESVPA